MKILINFEDFEPWGQAVATWEQVVDANKVDDLESYLDQIYPYGIHSVDLNDILAYESSEVLANVGILDSSLRSDIIDDIKERIKSLKDDIQEWELEAIEDGVDNSDEINETDEELTLIEALLENGYDDELLEYKENYM